MRPGMLSLTLAAAVLLTSAGSATAATAPPSVWAAAAQYVEMIPTSTGPRPTGTPGRTKPLPEEIGRAIERSAGTDRQALETLVTTSAWGANTSPKTPRKASPVKPSQKKTDGSAVSKPRPTETQALDLPLPHEGESFPEAMGGAVTVGGRTTFALVALFLLLAGFSLVRLQSRR